MTKETLFIRYIDSILYIYRLFRKLLISWLEHCDQVTFPGPRMGDIRWLLASQSLPLKIVQDLNFRLGIQLISEWLFDFRLWSAERLAHAFKFLFLWIIWLYFKGHLISEWPFGVFNFPKKAMQKFDEFSASEFKK